jgi:hypothetical protein
LFEGKHDNILEELGGLNHQLKELFILTAPEGIEEEKPEYYRVFFQKHFEELRADITKMH